MGGMQSDDAQTRSGLLPVPRDQAENARITDDTHCPYVRMSIATARLELADWPLIAVLCKTLWSECDTASDLTPH